MLFYTSKKKMVQALFFVAIATVFVGCGGGEDDAKSTNTTSTPPSISYTVSVVDDAITGATLSAPECATFVGNGNGSYTLKECIAKPSVITAIGGSFVIDGNITINQSAPLILDVEQAGGGNGLAITPLSTLASQEDSNLSGLAAALGVSQADLFHDNSAHRELMRSINAILITAREAGITQYGDFIKDLKEEIKTTGSLANAKASMTNPSKLAAYKAKYGIVFGGFVSDFASADTLQGIKSRNTVPTGKIRFGGFVYDSIVANASVTIKNGAGVIVGSASADDKGRYVIETDASALESPDIFTFEATVGTTKLIAYLTSAELKLGSFGSKITSGSVEDLIISNVTTAKAVLVDKRITGVKTQAEVIKAKAIVEATQAAEILGIASVIKDVVDYTGSLAGSSDTLALAQARANGTNTATYIDRSTEIMDDPVLEAQLDSTLIALESFRSLWEGTTWFVFDYDSDFASDNPFVYEEFKINVNGSVSMKGYRQIGGIWTVYENNTLPAGTVRWSSDGKIAYISDDYWAPERRTYLYKHSISTSGGNIDIHFVKGTVTAAPTDGFYTNFTTTYEKRSVGSYDDATKAVTHSLDGNETTVYLGDNGYMQFDSKSGTSTSIKYDIIIKGGEVFVAVHYPNDDGVAVYHVKNGFAYKKYIDPIGYTFMDWHTSSVTVREAWRNMDQSQKDGLVAKINNLGQYSGDQVRALLFTEFAQKLQ